MTILDNASMSPELLAKLAQCKKLLNLANGNASTQEMEAAIAGADRIMQRYRFTKAQVEASGSVATEPFITLKVSEGGRRTAWRETLLSGLCENYGCAWYLSSYRVGGSHFGHGRAGSKGVQSYTVVGKESDAGIVQNMFRQLEQTIENLSKFHNRGKGLGFAISWLNGCAQGVRSQFREMVRVSREQYKAETNGIAALVLLDKRAEEADKHMRNSQSGPMKEMPSVSGGRNYGALSEGYSVGKKINIGAVNTPNQSYPRLG